MEINDIRLDFDLYDADQGPAFLEHSENIAKLCAGMQGNKSTKPADLRDAIIKICDATGDMLDAVFGEGTRGKVFGTRHNLNDAIHVYETMNTEAEKQRAAMQARSERYSPNRAQRRAAKK